MNFPLQLSPCSRTELVLSGLSNNLAAMLGRQTPIYDRLVRKLTEALRPAALAIRDDTHLHASHAQSPRKPETHFHVYVVSDAFDELSLVERHRRIYSIVGDELSERVHALSITARTPKEAERSKSS